ncbi:amino acid permease [Truncatella angustata]|uniref:Amino acid permease n=1 Tax=Truncatella angustata TaxID=152316 RepID=A0A9P8RQN5_9PEZI|nr:amino acid permease [Truncatella angustata]KAH6647668.1 amino acid permease [Truncatella angustata]
MEIASNGNILDGGLQRGLKNRHLQMISLGGVVGASIWFGTGTAIAYSGPVGALICFLIIGIDVFFVMQSLGEMSTLFPIQGAFVELAGRFVDPALAFSLGWNYWYLWVTNIANDYNNISLVFQSWTDRVPSYGWILIFWAIFQGTSLLGVVVWGEMEFYLACWKLTCVLVVGFLVSILINTGAIGGGYIGFRYWVDPGPIANGINGFGQTFVLAAVYYCGTEMLAFTAAESRNPARDLPRAIRQTFLRILIVFIGLVFFAGLIVPYTSPELLNAKSKSAKSPWTIALVSAGWSGASNLLNVIMITAQFSSVNSGIYIASRTLVALARTGRAPRFFAKTTDDGTPIRAIVFSNTLGLISILNVASGPGKVFTYLIDISGAATFIAWAFVGITHLRLRAGWVRQGHSLDELPFRAWLHPWGTWFVVVINIFLVFISGYSVFVGGFAAVDFVFSYLVLAIFTILYVFWKVLKRTKFVGVMEMDLVTGRREALGAPGGFGENGAEEAAVQKTKSRPWYVKVKRFIFS